MTDLIASLVEFVFDNIGFIVGLLVVWAGISSSNKKKKRQAQERKDSDFNFEIDTKCDADTDSQAAPPKKFRDILAELQKELETEQRGDFEPQIPYEPVPGRGTQGKSHPWDNPAGKRTASAKQEPNVMPKPQPAAAKPKAAPAPQHHTVTPHTVVHQTRVQTHDLPDTTPQPAVASPLAALTELSLSDLVQGVIMAEVLGKPKAYRD